MVSRRYIRVRYRAVDLEPIEGFIVLGHRQELVDERRCLPLFKALSRAYSSAARTTTAAAPRLVTSCGSPAAPPPLRR